MVNEKIPAKNFKLLYALVLFMALMAGARSASAETITFSSSKIDVDNIGQVTDGRDSIPFTPTVSADTITPNLALCRHNSPTQGVRISVFDDNSGVPGSEIGGVDIPDSDITATFNSVTCTGFKDFSPISASISSGTQYWLVVSVASGTESGTDFYYNAVDNTGTAGYNYIVAWTSNSPYGMSGSITTSTTGGGGGGTATSTSSALPLTADDELFLWGVMLFFVSLIGWGVIFRPIQTI